MQETAYIGLGSNLGNREENLREAARMIGDLPGIRVCGVSSLYYTEPLGVSPQPWFFNAVLEALTTLTPEELLETLEGVESSMGRVEKGMDKPRTIDIDILTFGNHVIRSDRLIVPHPRMCERRFVLEPLVEIARNLIHPERLRAVGEILTALENSSEVLKKGSFYE